MQCSPSKRTGVSEELSLPSSRSKSKTSKQGRAIAQAVNFFYLCDGTLGTAATTGLLYQPRMIGDGDCGEIGGIKIGRGYRSTRRKPAPAPLCPPEIPRD
jgi:hypothetical protein